MHHRLHVQSRNKVYPHPYLALPPCHIRARGHSTHLLSAPVKGGNLLAHNRYFVYNYRRGT